jgi:methylamine---glutamate N-methyltransferase subunit A
MCGIAGLIHKGKRAGIGKEMTAMLQAMKHRGPDSTGYALYGPAKTKQYVMRFKVAEPLDISASHKKGAFDIHQALKDRKRKVDERLAELGAKVIAEEQPKEYAFRYEFTYDGELGRLADYIEDLDGVEILSLGHALELVKDLGDANTVAREYSLSTFEGTHAMGHTRMATESDVDIRSAHPYWAYPYSDISVVHNGQLTNYWNSRRALERKGHRFASDCDSELIAVYIADKLDQGMDLEAAMRASVNAFDGVFTYLVATGNALGMAKDTMAAKPMVLYEGDDFIAMASEEVAIRSIFPHEIDTTDPYDGEVRVWHS